MCLVTSRFYLLSNFKMLLQYRFSDLVAMNKNLSHIEHVTRANKKKKSTYHWHRSTFVCWAAHEQSATKDTRKKTVILAIERKPSIAEELDRKINDFIDVAYVFLRLFVIAGDCIEYLFIFFFCSKLQREIFNRILHVQPTHTHTLKQREKIVHKLFFLPSILSFYFTLLCAMRFI